MLVHLEGPSDGRIRLLPESVSLGVLQMEQFAAAISRPQECSDTLHQLPITAFYLHGTRAQLLDEQS